MIIKVLDFRLVEDAEHDSVCLLARTPALYNEKEIRKYDRHATMEVEVEVENKLGWWGDWEVDAENLWLSVGEMMWRQAKSDEVLGHDRSKTGKNQHEGRASYTIEL